MIDQQGKLSRRLLLKGVTASAGGLLLSGCGNTEPPTYGHLLRMGDLFTYKAHRLLLPGQSLAREYDYSDISHAPAIGTTDPGDASGPGYVPEYGETYARLRHADFADWRLTVEGSVARPGSFSLKDLQRLMKTSHVG